MKDLDFLQIVIFKKLNESHYIPLGIEDGEKLTLIGKPRFIYEIEQVLGHFRTTTYTRSFYQKKEMEIKENRTRYLMKITGFFFLLEDYKERLLKVLKILTDEGLAFHLTRLDMAWTLSEIPYDEFCHLLTKVKYSDTIERTLRDKKGRLTRVIFYNTRFMGICYNKQLQIKQKKSRDLEYKTLFAKKYQQASIRFELRLLSKAELIPMTILIRTNPEKFLENFPDYAIEKSSGRLTYFPLKLRKILFSNTQNKGDI